MSAIYTPEIRNCHKCGKNFDSGGTKRICATCRKPKTKRSAQGYSGKLSLRQRQVVERVVAGKLNKEIAGDLNLTEGTIKEYLFAIFRKTGTSNRTDLTRWWFSREIDALRLRIAELEKELR